ncbi:MAG: DUF4157 domain-containing protein, partial [Cyanobacteria bacterium J06633_2]
MAKIRKRIRERRKGSNFEETVNQSSIFDAQPIRLQAKNEQIQAMPIPPTRHALGKAQRFGHRFNQYAVFSDSSTRDRPEPTPHHHESLPTVQTKLALGEPNDTYEQEADRVSAQVVGHVNQPSNLPISGRRKKRRKHSNSLGLDIHPLVQREGAKSEKETVPGSAEKVIEQKQGQGSNLSDDVREPMESAFGNDFHDVSIHEDEQSDQLNQSMGSRAFTTGKDIFFRKGEYQPQNRDGQGLLAHELTHVVQQGTQTIQRIMRGRRGQQSREQNEPSDALPSIGTPNAKAALGRGGNRHSPNAPGASGNKALP